MIPRQAQVDELGGPACLQAWTDPALVGRASWETYDASAGGIGSTSLRPDVAIPRLDRWGIAPGPEYRICVVQRSRIDDWEILAFLETSRRFKGPVFAGDTLHYVATVREVRPSASKRDRGIVRVAMALHNQGGAVVQEGEDIFSVATGVQA